MSFLFKKKQVPEELPNLLGEEVVESLGKDITDSQSNEIDKQPIQQTNDLYARQVNTGLTNQNLNNLNKEVIAQPEESVQKSLAQNDEAGYFKDLVKSVTDETENLDKLDNWCKSKFVDGDIIQQMKEYWEKQKPEVLIRSIGGETKMRLLEKVEKLHKLEKEWQTAYFNLIDQEEKIREEEKELKHSLSELISLYKKTLNKRNKK